MMKKQTILPLFVTTAVLLSACQSENVNSLDITNTSQNSTLFQTNIDTSVLFSDRDMEVGYDEENAAHITLSGSSATCDSNAVSIDGSTITITDEGTYILSGTLDDGMILIDAEETDKIQIVLDNANIHCSDCAAFYIRQADKVFITTTSDSQNTLSSGDTFVLLDENNIDGTIFSKSDLTLNGLGSLTISSPSGHGIVTKDDLAITSGTYDITAAGHGLSGKDSVCIANGTFDITTGKDGVQSEHEEDAEKGFVYLADGTYTITAEGDGFSASSWMQVDGGNYTVTTGGGSANGESHTNSTQPGGGMGRGQRNPNMTNQQPIDGLDIPNAPTETERPEPPQTMEVPNDDASPIPANPDSSVSSGSSTTTSTDTASTKGLKAGTTLVIQQGTFILDCADDAFHTNGNLLYQDSNAQIQTGDDAFHADNLLNIAGGSINISTCYEGLEGLMVDISDGTIDIHASDDGINAAGGNDQSGFAGKSPDTFSETSGAYIAIAGGNITIDCGGDGIDSNGDLTVSGGNIYVSASENGADSALDYDGNALITGGVFIGVSASGMAQNFGDSSTQGSILVAVAQQSANSTISINNSSGNVLASWNAPKGYSSIVISCPSLESNGTYTIMAGDSVTEVTLDGLLYGQSSGPHAGGMRGEKQPPQNIDTQA